MPKFSRLERVIGSNNIDLLSKKTVLILGCGGVGGYVCEALARSGIGKIILVDYDRVDISNINRQIIALLSTVGKLKTDLLEERVKDINPDCEIKKIDEFINEDNVYILFQDNIDFLVDACDTVSTKKRVILECLNRDIAFISSMGTGNKLDPTKLDIVDIKDTINDPLARIMRKFVKDNNIKKKIMVLSSSELPVKTGDRIPGSTAFVPSCAGIIIASYIVRKLIDNK